MEDNKENENTESKSALSEGEFDKNKWLLEDGDKGRENLSNEEVEAARIAAGASSDNEDGKETEESIAKKKEEEKATELNENAKNKEPSNEIEADSDWSLESTNEVVETPEQIAKKETENASESSNKGWEKIATDLGVEANGYEDLIAKLTEQKSLATKGFTNERINSFENLKSYDDEALMREEFKAKKYNQEEIDDEIDILIENNTLKSAARIVRKDIDAVIENEKQAMTSTPSQTDAMQQQEVEEAQKGITDIMSKTNEMYGGKISDSQKTEHADYINSGKFFDEVSQNAESTTQAAWLWRYRNQIMKSISSSGFEKGKGAILDKMINPESNRKSNIPNPITGDFNKSAFMETETM